MGWPRAEPVESQRLRLVPLSVEHAEHMVEVLADPALYEYTGGGPPTLGQLRDRYATQVVGHSADGTHGWLNWVVTLAGSAEPVGYVQATLQRRERAMEAEIAWVIAPRHQGQGLATEAATTMTTWLRAHGVEHLVAHVHPAHDASAGVARNVGLRPTGTVDDGEDRWQS